MDVVLEGLPEHELEMGTFRTVAVMVGSLVVGLGHRHVEHSLRPLYLGGNLGQVGYLQGSPVLVDDVHHVDAVEIQFPVLHLELVLRKFKRLVNQIYVLVLHFSDVI